jgi:superfamily II DNA or RNA helicase
MAAPKHGLHEALLTQALELELEQLEHGMQAERRPLHAAEAADRLALHVGSLLRRSLTGVRDTERKTVGIQLTRRLVQIIGSVLDLDGSVTESELPRETAEVLRAILALRPDGSLESIEAPLIPLLDTTLLTNSPGEPRVGRQIETEVLSADRIDVVMAFIRQSGIRPLLEGLRQHTAAGRELRILTTTYTGSTEQSALDKLQDLGASVRVSYDTTTTRLHAKAWLFHRESGYSTAYVGSSNLTFSAQVTGLEWNVRASAARNADVVDKVAAVFESYWQSGEFEPYERDVFSERSTQRDSGPKIFLSPVEIRPEPFQERLLEQLELSRSQGHHRNLLVSATGTGKTVMAAVDYQRLRKALPRARLLFVAHRKEILEQSLATFRHALRDHSFGELWVGGARPGRFEHVFASIQSLNAAGFTNLAPDHFDMVIVDEFHHAAAKSYEALLTHVRPVELLGLTATPERSDGLPVLQWFGDRIAAELRLWDAIDQHRLTPFLYFGVHDGIDLSEIPWRRGRGYDVEALTGVLTASDRWARLVLKQVEEHVDDISGIRALGFCVSVEHARFMARVFQDHGVRAVAVWGDSPAKDREQALRDLANRKIQVLFSVDLFNEGVDVPTVDTVLFLRPTDSPTLFLQQLGRGLRRADGKSACTVLDFVGQHRSEFRMDRRMQALLGGSRKDLIQQVENGFPFLPAGCHMELDAKATKVVLASIRASIPSHFKERAAELARLARSQASGDVTLPGFLDESGMELEDVYANNRSWSDLRAEAGLPVAAEGPNEKDLRRACSRLLHVDDNVRLKAFEHFLSFDAHPLSTTLSEPERRLLRALVGSTVGIVCSKTTDLDTGARLLWKHPQVLAEIRELFGFLRTRIAHVHHSLPKHPDVPIEVHARYTRREALAVFGYGGGAKIMNWQAGVLWAEDAKADLLAFTLDKTSGQFSPTTRYRDYAISPSLIHWESQSMTRAESETGLRYQHHAARGSSVMLFARLRADEKAFWFLGPATYVSHTSERPMGITWRLEHPLPGDLFAQFAAAVA